MDHVERIREQGYTVLERVLPDDLRERVRRELAPCLQGARMGRNVDGRHPKRLIDSDNRGRKYHGVRPGA